jgi:hypothetical protein
MGRNRDALPSTIPSVILFLQAGSRSTRPCQLSVCAQAYLRPSGAHDGHAGYYGYDSLGKGSIVRFLYVVCTRERGPGLLLAARVRELDSGGQNQTGEPQRYMSDRKCTTHLG